jgi:hypothetical protein
MAAAFGGDALLDAFDRIGRAAVRAETKLQIAVYGGSALMLASNFRFATEDIDVSQLERSLPNWLEAVVHEIAEQNHWQEDWFNDAVAFHLSPLADHAADHLEFGTFPRDGTPPGLVVSVPSAEYLRALKLKSARVLDPLRGKTERLDILNLMKVVGISTAEEAIALLGRYFSAECRFLREAAVSAEKHESRGRRRCTQIPSLMQSKESRPVHRESLSSLSSSTRSIWQKPIRTAMRRSSVSRN